MFVFLFFQDKQHAWHPHLLNNEVSHQQEPFMLLVRPLPCGPAALPLHRPASAAFNNDKSIRSLYPSSSHIRVVSQCSWEIDSTHKALNPGGSLKKQKPNWSVSFCSLFSSPLFFPPKGKIITTALPDICDIMVGRFLEENNKTKTNNMFPTFDSD